MEEVKSEDDTFDLLTRRKESLAEGITAHSLFSPTMSEFDDSSKSPKPYYFNDDTLTTNNTVPQLNSRDLFGSFGSSEGESSSSESELDEDKHSVVCSNKSRDNSPANEDPVSPIAFIYEDTPLLSTEMVNEITTHKKIESPKNRRDDILKMKLAHVKETPAKSPAAEDTKETVIKKREETKHKNGVKKKKKFELSNFVKKAETNTEEATSEDTDTTTTLSEPSTNTEPSVALVESKLTPSPSVKVTETLNTPEVPPIETKTTKHEKINSTVAASATNQKKKRNWRFSGSESESASSSSDDEILVSAAKKTKVDKFDSDNEEQSDKELMNKTEVHSHRGNTATGNSNTDTKSIKSDRSSSNNASKILSNVTKKSDDRNSSVSKKPTNDKPKIREFDFCSTLTQSQQRYSSTTRLPGIAPRDQRLVKALVNGKKPGGMKATGATNVLKVSSPMKSLSRNLKRPGPPKPKTVESLSNNNLTNHSSPDEVKQNHKQTPAVADEAEKLPSSEKDSVLAAKFPLKRRALQNPVLKF